MKRENGKKRNFKTLEEVLEFYNEGGGVGHGIAYKNQTLPEEKLGLTAQEMQAIIAFMQALTDFSYNKAN